MCPSILSLSSALNPEPRRVPRFQGNAIAALDRPVSCCFVTAAMPIIACSLLTVSLFCSLFGTQVTPPAPILKALPKIFGHSDKAVRSEGTNLAHALYQYLGTGIEPWITDLKPVQVKELKEAWESMEKEGRGKGCLKPERMTRQQARDAEQNADSGEGDAGDGSAVLEGVSTISNCLFKGSNDEEQILHLRILDNLQNKLISRQNFLQTSMPTSHHPNGKSGRRSLTIS